MSSLESAPTSPVPISTRGDPSELNASLVPDDTMDPDANNPLESYDLPVLSSSAPQMQEWMQVRSKVRDKEKKKKTTKVTLGVYIVTSI